MFQEIFFHYHFIPPGVGVGAGARAGAGAAKIEEPGAAKNGRLRNTAAESNIITAY